MSTVLWLVKNLTDAATLMTGRDLQRDRSGLVVFVVVLPEEESLVGQVRPYGHVWILISVQIQSSG
jgi:hypothetical protein